LPRKGGKLNRFSSIAIGLALLTAAAQATPVTFNFTGSAGGDTQNAQAEFIISNCGMTACQLDVIIRNNIVSPNDAANGIIGLSFNIGSLTAGGTLNSTVTNGSGGKVSLITLPSDASAGSTNTLNEWTFGYASSPNAGCQNGGAFCLDGHSLGGQPTEMIIGAGATGGNASVGNFNNWVAGTVDFQIDNFTGLNANSTFTNVMMDFGTGPDGGLSGGTCSMNCNLVTTPEPFTFMLAGTGLLALGLFRRKAR
jgi:hypothetical protein